MILLEISIRIKVSKNTHYFLFILFIFLDLEIFLDDGINLEDVDDELLPDTATDAEDNRNNYQSDGGYNSSV